MGKAWLFERTLCLEGNLTQCKNYYNEDERSMQVFAGAGRVEKLIVGEDFSNKVSFELGLEGCIGVIRSRREGGT